MSSPRGSPRWTMDRTISALSAHNPCASMYWMRFSRGMPLSKSAHRQSSLNTCSNSIPLNTWRDDIR
eukprot:scaffold82672_cov75-Phaeocystis_antarctica.AAC.7